MLFYGRPHVVRDRKRAYELACGARCRCRAAAVAIREAGVVEGLVRLLGSGDADVQKEAARAVWTTALDNVENKDAFVGAGAVHPAA
jgi:hypothetical protein